jgi:hypothetical protein
LFLGKPVRVKDKQADAYSDNDCSPPDKAGIPRAAAQCLEHKQANQAISRKRKT